MMENCPLMNSKLTFLMEFWVEKNCMNFFTPLIHIILSKCPLLTIQCHFLYLQMENKPQADFREQVYVESCLREARLCHMAINCISEVFWKLVEISAYSNRCVLGAENTGWKLDAFCISPTMERKGAGAFFRLKYEFLNSQFHWVILKWMLGADAKEIK